MKFIRVMMFGLLLSTALMPALFPIATAAEPNFKLESVLLAITHTKPQIEYMVGTGFLTAPSGLVVTADHVIVDDDGRPYREVWAIQPLHPQLIAHKLKLVRRLRTDIVGRDVAILKPEKPIPGVGLPIGGSVELGDPVLIGGFPLVFDKVYFWPLLRRGSVASTRYIYEDAPILLLDLISTMGFSGSPVINEKTGRVVGVLRGGSKFHPHAGFSVASPLNESDLEGLAE